MLRRVAAIAGVCAGALALTACGGGGGSTSGAVGVSKAAFVKRADAICKKSLKHQNATMTTISERLASEGGSSVSTERMELVMKAIVPTQQRMVAALSSLEAPEADGAMIEKVLSGLEKGIERLEDKPSVAFESVVVTPANLAIEKYGLPECTV